MSLTDSTSPAVTADDIAGIAQDVWGSFLDMELVTAAQDDGEPFAGESVTGCVHVAGAWGGSVLVEATTAHATAAAEAMFAADPGSLSWDEVSDALGELTNMVGGNVKGLLPAPSTLSIPSVAGGSSYTLRVPGAALASRVLLQGPAGPVRISLWRS